MTTDSRPAPIGVLTRLLLLGALVIAAVGDTRAHPLPPQRQPSAPAHDLSRLRDWIDAVDRHLPGQRDAAAAEVGTWSRAELEVLLLDFDALLQLITAPERPKFPRANRDFTPAELEQLRALALREGWRAAGRPITFVRELTEAGARRAVNRLVKRAALLHTDVAALVAAAADTRTASAVPVPRPLLPLRTSVQIEDGVQVGITFYGTHWDFARLLLDEVRPDPARDVVVREWYRTIAALFASQHLWAESSAHLTRARRLFPADSEIIAASGRLHESYAAPRIQNFLESVGRADLVASIGSPRSNLRQAETFFRKAVELDDGFVEARLHLGRVMTLEGRHEEAADQLRRAATAAGNSETQYCAWLFLGVAEQSLGRADRARESFDKAAALYPRAQSAYLALSQLARRSGDRSGALQAIGQVLSLSASDRQREDPWLTYLQGNAAEAQTRLAGLRAVLFLTQAERLAHANHRGPDVAAAGGLGRRDGPVPDFFEQGRSRPRRRARHEQRPAGARSPTGGLRGPRQRRAAAGRPGQLRADPAQSGFRVRPERQRRR